MKLAMKMPMARYKTKAEAGNRAISRARCCSIARCKARIVAGKLSESWMGAKAWVWASAGFMSWALAGRNRL